MKINWTISNRFLTRFLTEDRPDFLKKSKDNRAVLKLNGMTISADRAGHIRIDLLRGNESIASIESPAGVLLHKADTFTVNDIDVRIELTIN